MYWISFGIWSSSHGSIFDRYRVTYRGRQLPIVKVCLRYWKYDMNTSDMMLDHMDWHFKQRCANAEEK
jgi:hypothetical protein